MNIPNPIPEPGWVPIVPFPLVEGTFLADGERVRLAYLRAPDDATLYARAWFGSKAMGPPGHVHGGAMAATLDEAMGAAAWMHNHRCVAATIKVTFLEMLPIETETTVEAKIDRVEGRKIHLRATLTSNATVVAEATGLFIVLSDERLKELSR